MMTRKTLNNKTFVTLKKVSTMIKKKRNTKKYRNTKKIIRNMKIRKNKITGGANCPRIGYSQHLGECWHDGISTALLYSDVLSEHHQKIFDDPEFNLESIITTAREKSDKRLLPLNIEDKDYDKFETLSRGYINSLYERYMNDKLPTASELMKISSKKNSTMSTKKWSDVTRTRTRRGSISMSLSCVENLFGITNINNIHPRKYEYTSHGGNTTTYYESLATVNYFLTSYKNNKYIDMSVFNIKELKKGTYAEIISKLKSTKDKINRSHAVLLNLKIMGDEMKGHIISLLTCNGENYVYDDNNGIHSSYDSGNELWLSEKFDWKTNLTALFDKLIKEFEATKSSDIDFSEQQLKIFNNFDTKNIRQQLGALIGKYYLTSLSFLSINILELKDVKDDFLQLQIMYNNPEIIFTFNNQKIIAFVDEYLLKIKDKYDGLIKYFLACVMTNKTLAYHMLDFIISQHGVHKITKDGLTLLDIIFLITVDYSIDKDNIETEKKYIEKLITNGFNFTNKNMDGNNILKFININKLNSNPLVVQLATFMNEIIIAKITTETSNLDTFKKLIKDSFFEDFSKEKLIERWKNNHKKQ